ncbi:hypothetical protein H0H92_015033, partial [Tricholoma furcatifolium]
MSAYIMYTHRDWQGYAGGLAFAFFLMSIIPIVLRRAVLRAQGDVARVFGAAMGTYCLLNLASIFTVAYAFVPGGAYLRERTDAVLVAQLACLALAFGWPPINDLRQLTVVDINRKTASFGKALLAIVSILSVLGTLYRWPAVAPRPWKSGPRIFNAGIWTVHFGIDNVGRDSQRGMTDLL